MRKLKKGDKVAVISPSGKVEESHIKKNCKLLTQWGLEVIYGKHAFDQYNKLAGEDKNRLSDLQWALDNDDIKAVFCTRGGYGLVRIIDEINWSKFTVNPKAIIGFSDVTVLHNHINRMGIQTIHAPMPNSYNSTPKNELNSLKAALFENNYQYSCELFEKHKVTGGNLAIVYSLIGTNSDINTTGKVLFLEEIGEYAYNVDRMLRALKKAGKFDGIKGLTLGHFTNIKDDNFGFSVKEIIKEVTKEYSFPIIYNLPIGHEDNNHALVLG